MIPQNLHREMFKEENEQLSSTMGCFQYYGVLVALLFRSLCSKITCRKEKVVEL